MTRAYTIGAYFDWLMHETKIDDRGDYILLMKDLFTIPFTVSGLAPNDTNRISDALLLRESFFDDSEDYCEDLAKPCCFLEILVALAKRADEIMSEPGERHLDEWFFRLLKNVGLDKFTDENYDSFDVKQITLKVINRKYQRNGKGGLFPVKVSYPDQRKVELWYQLNTWLSEKY